MIACLWLSVVFVIGGIVIYLVDIGRWRKTTVEELNKLRSTVNPKRIDEIEKEILIIQCESRVGHNWGYFKCERNFGQKQFVFRCTFCPAEKRKMLGELTEFEKPLIGDDAKIKEIVSAC